MRNTFWGGKGSTNKRPRVNMASGGRDARSAEAGPTPTAKRGRLNDRAWRDVRRAARIAREEGVSLRVHGVEVTGLLKQLKVAKKRVHGAKQQPAETAAPKQTAAPASEPLPPQLVLLDCRQRYRRFDGFFTVW